MAANLLLPLLPELRNEKDDGAAAAGLAKLKRSLEPDDGDGDEDQLEAEAPDLEILSLPATRGSTFR